MTLKAQLSPIGFYDSGIGGFSILKEVHDLLPMTPLIYFADDAHAPYGKKNPEFVMDRARIVTKELIKRDVKLIVIACNTATAVAIDELRKEFPIQFVGVEPYLNALNKHPELKDPGLKTAVATTVLTGQSKRFMQLRQRLDPEAKLTYFGLPNLASLIEDEFYRHSSDFEEKITRELEPIKAVGASHLILGCTHYPLVQKSIERILNLKAISPCRFVANRVLEVYNGLVKEHGTFVDSCSDFEFFSSKENLWKKNSFALFNGWPR